MLAQVKKSILGVSNMKGVACTEVVVGKGKNMTDNEIIDIIRDNGYKFVVFTGSLEKYPDIAPIARGLADIAFKVIITTKADDDISPLRANKNIKFVVFAKPPTAKENNIRQSTVNLLKDTDELYMVVDTKADFDSALAYLKEIYLTIPIVVFFTDKVEIEDYYLEHAASLGYKHRVGK